MRNILHCRIFIAHFAYTYTIFASFVVWRQPFPKFLSSINASTTGQVVPVITLPTIT